MAKQIEHYERCKTQWDKAVKKWSEYLTAVGYEGEQGFLIRLTEFGKELFIRLDFDLALPTRATITYGVVENAGNHCQERFSDKCNIAYDFSGNIYLQGIKATSTDIGLHETETVKNVHFGLILKACGYAEPK